MQSNRSKNILKGLPNWLVITLIFVSIIRIPTLFMPYSYGDEMIYLTLGEGIRQNLTLYKDIHDNKPPLIYILAAIAGDLANFKLILAFWNLASIVIFFKLSQTLFSKDKSLVKISTIVFSILTNLPLLEGNIVNSEILMIAPIMLSFIVAITKKDNPKYLFLSGLIFSIAILLKVPAIFDLPAIIFLWIINTQKINRTEIKSLIKRTFFLGSGVLLPIAFTFIWYFGKGALDEYLKAAFLQNISYLSSWRPESKIAPFYIRNGPLLIRALIVLLGVFACYLARKKIGKKAAFIAVWLLFSLFAATLSERPYPHYLVQAVPAISLTIGGLFANKIANQAASIILLTLTFSIPVYFKFWYYPSLPFYANFAKLALKKIDQDTYLKYFDPKAKRNYEIARFIKESTNRNDKIFVWGDDSKIYALSKRLPPIKYVADYHIKDFEGIEKIEEKIIKTKPKVVVIFPKTERLDKVEEWLQENYIRVSLPQAKDGTRLLILKANRIATP